VRRNGRGDGMARVTIGEVAALAAVSTATASRALNRPDAVSAGLRARVDAAVATLRYVPNQTARALSSLRSGLVGVLVPALTDDCYAPQVVALHRHFEAAGYAVLLAVTGGDAIRAMAQASAMIGREVEGLVIAGSAIRPPLDAMLRERRIPVVCIDGAAPGTAEGACGIDYRLAGETVGRYLLSYGHRRIGFLADARPGVDRDGLLLAGLRQACSITAALPAPAFDIGAADRAAPDRSFATSIRAKLCDSDAQARGAVREWFGQAVRPTAMVCANDLLAIAALRECASLRVTVPEGCSIVGCGDLPFARNTKPTLTTLRIPAPESGRIAAVRLLALMAGRSTGALAPSFKLIVRQSSGPATTTPES